MYNFAVVRFTNRLDGTAGNSFKPYENEGEALKEFFQTGKIDRATYEKFKGMV